MKNASISVRYPFFVIEYYKSGKILKKHTTSPIRLKYRLNQVLNWRKIKKVYLKVLYGFDKANNGKKTMFYNDGDYTNKKDLNMAFSAFMEGYKWRK